MKIKKGAFISTIVVMLLLTIYIIYLVFGINKIDSLSIISLFSFVFNSFICILFIIKDTRGISLNKIFLYFNLFFLCIAPLMQYANGIDLWNYKIPTSVYLYVNLMILLWMLIFEFFQFIFYNKYKKRKKIIDYNLKYNTSTLIFLQVLTLIALLYMIKCVSFSGLFLRNNNYLNIDSAAMQQIIMAGARAIPVYTLLYTFYYYKTKKINKIYYIIPIISTVMLNFPTSVARYWLAIVYIGIAVAIFEDRLKNRTFDIMIALIFIILFPIFQLFKWYGLEILANANIVSSQLSAIYNNVDFDAYSMFARTVMYVSDNGLNWGNQLLAIIFFIVPRSIWVNKPVPTGQFIATEQGQNFTNLSCPLVAEGYFAYGFMGVILFSLLLSWLASYFDVVKEKEFGNYKSIINFIYPFLFGSFVYLQRGSVQPAVVFIFSFYLFIIIYYIIGKLVYYLKRRARI